MAAWDILSFHGKIKLNQLSTWDFPLLDFAKLMVDIIYLQLFLIKKSKTDAWWWVPVCMGINN
jgi:hypothetical protein